MKDFDKMATHFTVQLEAISHWKHCYHGAAYSTRIKAAIADLKRLIAETESHPEIGGKP